MKKLFNEILTFEVFFEIFKFIHDYLSITDTNRTDVQYYFGNEDGSSLQNIPYGHFKIRAYPDQIEYLGKEILVLEPFGKATAEEETEYYALVLNVHNMHGGNYSILMQQKGHMGAAIANTLRRIKLNIDQMTNVVILCPMNISNNNDIYYQTRYHFENLIYTKEGELYLPYYTFARKVHDNRD